MRRYDWAGFGRMTHGEYRANLNGLGIFFGAVLGFVMAGTETLAPLDYALTLSMSAAAVICILYISASPRRIAYTLVAIFVIAMLPTALHQLLSKGAQIPPNLQPTLAVWLGITVLVEFAPRERPAAGEPAEAADGD
ncbi:hypothetical protein [Sphingomonas sp.]|uniref:hypothetical protein n=1 Tax=Sphingomonas sp. TaxID=28214 RepID=UPI001B2F0CB5|nr:hypothetical protein [Sphingomonas sp.]MBO9713337.1 hypothetical protein [Sphingomonas sp.]